MNATEFEIAGDVVEWQTLLNGMRIASIEGASVDGDWTLSLSVSWNVRSGPDVSEGDLTLTRPDGAELYATLTEGRIGELPSGAADAAGYGARLEFAVDGGAEELAYASGVISADGQLSREGCSLRVRIAVRSA